MKSLAKKIVATALTVASIATMTTCVATVNAANMEYHIDTTRKASLTLHKYEMSDTSLATHKATGTTDDAQYVPADAKPLANVQSRAGEPLAFVDTRIPHKRKNRNGKIPGRVVASGCL